MAEVRAVHEIVQIGRPVWVDFTVHNATEERVQLGAAGAGPVEVEVPVAMGLPLGHVFSAREFRTIEISSGNDTSLGDRMTLPAMDGAPAISLAPGGSVGRRIDLTRYFPVLRRAGAYRVQWKPYDGALVSNTAAVTVTSLKQAVLATDFGRITIRFDYDRAPKHVANYIELARSGFYDTTVIHRVIPGILIQGGDPRGDGTGVRHDGVTLKAELSDVQFDRGTVAMARKPGDADSASCQFFMCLTRVSEFDGTYTVFGHLEGPASFETLDRISRVRIDRNDRPIRPVYIRSVTIEDLPLVAPKRLAAPMQEARAKRIDGPGAATRPVLRAPVREITKPETPPATAAAAEAAAPDSE